MRICIRGYCLQVGSHRGTKRRYMHCPECGCFHQVKTPCFLGEGGYKCMRCLVADKTITCFWKCAYCEDYIAPRWVKRQNCGPTGPQGDWKPPKTTITVLRTEPHTGDDEFFDPMVDSIGMVQDIFFCNKHYGYARRITKNTAGHAKYGIKPIIINKQELLKRIGNRQTSNAIRSDGIRFTQRGYSNNKE